MTDSPRSQPAAGAEPRPEPAPAPQAPDPRRWKALILLCVTAFMVILDSQIVILALPTIEQQLRFAPGGGQWVLTAYLLAFGGLLLFGGRLADLRGRRQMFIAGTVPFGVSSLLCGLAWSAGVLVGARVVQGVSAAIMAPAALAILMTTFPDGPERNKALAFYSTAGGLGATAALLIGPVAAVAAALSGVDEEIAGVASGANNAAFQIGGALSAAVVTGVVVSQVGGSTVPAVLAEGFRAGAEPPHP